MIEEKKETTICGNCDVEFESTIGRRPKKFCSPKCRSEFHRKKVSELLKLSKENLSEMGKAVQDQITLGVAITQTTENGVKRVDPLSEKGQEVWDTAQKIKELEEELKTVPDTGIGKQRRKWIEKQIKLLQ
jgi:hypothetical protein